MVAETMDEKNSKLNCSKREKGSKQSDPLLVQLNSTGIRGLVRHARVLADVLSLN